MKFAVMGSGAMGSLIGGLLRQNGEDVVLIDPWEEHVDNINQNRLNMQVVGGEVEKVKIRATKDPSDVGVVDGIFFLVKGMSTDHSIREALPMIGKDTVIFTLQNGLGNVEKLAEVVDVSQLAFGVIDFSSVLTAPGEIRYQLANGEIFAKTANGEKNNVFEEMVNRMNRSKLNTYISEDVDFRIWNKLVINANFNTLCAITGLNMGELMDQEAGVNLMEGITQEVVAVANKKGIGLVYDDCMAHIKELGSKVRQHYPSMAQDVSRKVATEIDFLNGAVVRAGKRHGVPTPNNEAIVNMLKVIENTYEQGKTFRIAK